MFLVNQSPPRKLLLASFLVPLSPFPPEDCFCTHDATKFIKANPLPRHSSNAAINCKADRRALFSQQDIYSTEANNSKQFARQDVKQVVNQTCSFFWVSTNVPQGADLPRVFDLDFTPMLEKPQAVMGSQASEQEHDLMMDIGP